MRNRLTSSLFAAASVLALGVGLVGCSADPEVAAATESSTQQTVLAAYDLDGKDAPEIIDELDQMSLEDRPADLYASVRPEGLLIKSGEDQEFTIDMLDEKFYLSFAPYVDTTHDCFFHSLTTCTGELGGEEINVRLVTNEGEEIVNETTNLYDNGFVGYWLDRNVEGTIEVTYGDLRGSVPFSTAVEDPTCLTNLKLS